MTGYNLEVGKAKYIKMKGTRDTSQMAGLGGGGEVAGTPKRLVLGIPCIPP